MGAHAAADISFNILGYVGGAILSICLLPQLVVLLRTQCSADLSLQRLLLDVLGLACSLAYLIYERAQAAWVPMVLELLFTVLTLLYKILLDCRERHRASVLENCHAPALPPAASAALRAHTTAAGGAAAASRRRTWSATGSFVPYLRASSSGHASSHRQQQQHASALTSTWMWWLLGKEEPFCCQHCGFHDENGSGGSDGDGADGGGGLTPATVPAGNWGPAGGGALSPVQAGKVEAEEVTKLRVAAGLCHGGADGDGQGQVSPAQSTSASCAAVVQAFVPTELCGSGGADVQIRQDSALLVATSPTKIADAKAAW